MFFYSQSTTSQRVYQLLQVSAGMRADHLVLPYLLGTVINTLAFTPYQQNITEVNSILIVIINVKNFVFPQILAINSSRRNYLGVTTSSKIVWILFYYIGHLNILSLI